jgi:hypothetical protein
MRRHTLSTIVFTSLLAVVPCALQGQNVIVPFIGGGLARGIGDLGENAGNGWMVVGGVDLGVDALTPGFAIGLAGSFANIPYDSDFNEAVQVTALDLEASLTIGDEASMVRPFVRGGGGFHMQRNDPGDIPDRIITAKGLGFSAGAGVNVMAGPVDVRVGARFSSAPGGGAIGLYGALAIPLR